jgi:DNA invertase Pin-like site-specific DNA recombinase
LNINHIGVGFDSPLSGDTTLAMATAYSFIRFSSPEQAKGDSLRRQLEASERFATERSLILDSSFRDLGKSASKGQHVGPTGALGRFISLVESGDIRGGSWLIVEDMDRLDRRQVNIALKQFLSLLEAGITIHTMIDGQTYTLDRINEDLRHS